MTPIFEKNIFLGFCRIFGLQTMPAAWPGAGPPIPILKKFPKKFQHFFFKFFLNVGTLRRRWMTLENDPKMIISESIC